MANSLFEKTIVTAYHVWHNALDYSEVCKLRKDLLLVLTLDCNLVCSWLNIKLTLLKYVHICYLSPRVADTKPIASK